MEILARGVGRRKEAVAQVQIIKGTGLFIINQLSAQQYLHNNTCLLLTIKNPLSVLNVSSSEIITDITPTVEINSLHVDNIDTIVKVKGGGLVGQAEAIKLGLARAICSLSFQKKTDTVSTVDLTVTTSNLLSQKEGLTNSDYIRKQLKDKGYLTQDSRVKERRKYGLKKARKATQYNKR
uniref:Small ribosomal subunit protein uS9c n=1 Tax=Haematococcus lacustris TaxID=44745 RepID=A0A0S2IDI1_HAELA|nr:30S ribosomal protein S9 [Haematococcus lacustris]ALO21592.1 ribosomal protein S9 [Haematococcus lacustris]AUW36536.1 30S ribosomal protein S9 [Haematococcus lacustris]